MFSEGYRQLEQPIIKMFLHKFGIVLYHLLHELLLLIQILKVLVMHIIA